MRRPFSIAFPKGGVDQKLSPRTFPGPRLRGRSGSPFRGAGNESHSARQLNPSANLDDPAALE